MCVYMQKNCICLLMHYVAPRCLLHIHQLRVRVCVHVRVYMYTYVSTCCCCCCCCCCCSACCVCCCSSSSLAHAERIMDSRLEVLALIISARSPRENECRIIPVIFWASHCESDSSEYKRRISAWIWEPILCSVISSSLDTATPDFFFEMSVLELTHCVWACLYVCVRVRGDACAHVYEIHTLLSQQQFRPQQLCRGQYQLKNLEKK